MTRSVGARWFGALALVIAGGACRSAPDADAPAGVVIEARGAVAAVASDGAWRPLAVSDQVRGTDTVETGADGRVSIRLFHNKALWSLGAGFRRRVDQSAAWSAPMAAASAGGPSERDRTAAAGRHAEREAAETAPPRAANEAAPAPPPAPAPPAATSAAAEDAARAEAAADTERRSPERATERADAPGTSARRSKRGSGGGGSGSGGLGLGDVGTVGHGAGAGTGAGGGRGTSADAGPRVRSTVASVDGPLPREVVRRILRRYAAHARACRARQLQATPRAPAVHAQLEFQIAPDGSVQRLDIKGAPRPLATCLRSRLEKMRFPTESAPTRFTQTLAFE